MDVKLMQLSHPGNSIGYSLLKIKPLFTNNHFLFHPLRWKCKSPNGQHSQNLVHEVKEGESFTMYDIAAAAAANKDRVVADLVFEGQLLSVIPTSMKMEKGKATVSSESGKVRSLGLCSRCMKEKTFTVLSSFPHSSHAKTTGYFLLLVPLIAFCIRFVMGALHNRVAEEFKHNVSESDDPHPRCKRTRWRSALQELRDPDANALDTDLSTDHDHSADDEEEIKQDDLSHNYTMLESDYAKFLSECGISNCGYWRGGSPK